MASGYGGQQRVGFDNFHVGPNGTYWNGSANYGGDAGASHLGAQLIGKTSDAARANLMSASFPGTYTRDTPASQAPYAYQDYHKIYDHQAVTYSRIVLEWIRDEDDYMLKLALPIELTKNMHFVVTKLWGGPIRVPQVPHHGIPPLLTQKISTRAHSLVRHSIAFEQEIQYAETSPYGDEAIRMFLYQIASSMNETLSYDGHIELLEAPHVRRLQMDEAKTRPTRQTLQEMFDAEVSNYAIFAQPRGMEITIDRVTALASQWEFKPDMLVSAEGTRLCITWKTENHRVDLSGKQADAVLARGSQALGEWRGVRIYNSRRYKTAKDGILDDPLSYSSEVGEYYVMAEAASTAGSADARYTTAQRSIVLYDEDRDDHFMVDILAALRECGRFDKLTGELNTAVKTFAATLNGANDASHWGHDPVVYDSVQKQIAAAGRVVPPGERDALKSRPVIDPLVAFNDATGMFAECQYFGQMEYAALDDAVLANVARTMHDACAERYGAAAFSADMEHLKNVLAELSDAALDPRFAVFLMFVAIGPTPTEADVRDRLFDGAGGRPLDLRTHASSGAVVVDNRWTDIDVTEARVSALGRVDENSKRLHVFALLGTSPQASNTVADFSAQNVGTLLRSILFRDNARFPGGCANWPMIDFLAQHGRRLVGLGKQAHDDVVRARNTIRALHARLLEISPGCALLEKDAVSANFRPNSLTAFVENALLRPQPAIWAIRTREPTTENIEAPDEVAQNGALEKIVTTGKARGAILASIEKLRAKAVAWFANSHALASAEPDELLALEGARDEFFEDLEHAATLPVFPDDDAAVTDRWNRVLDGVAPLFGGAQDSTVEFLRTNAALVSLFVRESLAARGCVQIGNEDRECVVPAETTGRAKAWFGDDSVPKLDDLAFVSALVANNGDVRGATAADVRAYAKALAAPRGDGFPRRGDAGGRATGISDALAFGAQNDGAGVRVRNSNAFWGALDAGRRIRLPLSMSLRKFGDSQCLVVAQSRTGLTGAYSFVAPSWDTDMSFPFVVTTSDPRAVDNSAPYVPPTVDSLVPVSEVRPYDVLHAARKISHAAVDFNTTLEQLESDALRSAGLAANRATFVRRDGLRDLAGDASRAVADRLAALALRGADAGRARRFDDDADDLLADSVQASATRVRFARNAGAALRVRAEVPRGARFTDRMAGDASATVLGYADEPGVDALEMVRMAVEVRFSRLMCLRLDELHADETDRAHSLMGMVFLTTPVHMRSLEAFARANVSIPFTVLLVRNRIRHQMSAMLMLASGGVIGRTYIGHKFMGTQDDVLQDKILFKFDYYAKSVIQRPEYVYSQYNVAWIKYEGGCGSDFKEHACDKRASARHGVVSADDGHGSIWALLTAPTERSFPNPMDLTGSFGTAFASHVTDAAPRSEARPFHHLCAPFYSVSDKFVRAPHMDRNYNETDAREREGQINTVAWWGYQRNYHAGSRGFDDVHENTGHCGYTRPGVRRVRNGTVGVLSDVFGTGIATARSGSTVAVRA